MKRSPRPVIALLALATAAVATWEGRSSGFSSLPRAVSIDGNRFGVDREGGDDLSLIRRELRRMGCEPPREDWVETSRGPILSGAFREMPPAAPDRPCPLPKELRTNHVMRVDRDGARIDIAFGTVCPPGPSFRTRVCSAGWECRPAGAGRDHAYVVTKTREKESEFVLLEEKDGTFFYLRRVEE